MPTDLATYTTLRDDILAVLHTARERTRQLVERELTTAYFQVGHRLDAHLQAHSGQSAEAKEVVQQLATDLDLQPRRLYEMLQIYRAFPEVRTSALLTWSHYITLLQAPEANRDHFYHRAVDENLSVRQLAAAIRTGVLIEAPTAPATPTPTLQTRRGQLHAYRLVDSLRPDGITALALDLGFGLRRDVPLHGLDQPRTGLIVTAQRHGTTQTFAAAALTRDRIYTFVAVVRRVVDGDTLLVEVDCGWDCRVVQRLRLRGLDAPELKTAEGARARAFVSGELSRVDFVVVKTFRPDKYDRYLADVFYAPGETDAHVVAAEGVFLNRLLVQRGLARTVAE